MVVINRRAAILLRKAGEQLLDTRDAMTLLRVILESLPRLTLIGGGNTVRWHGKRSKPVMVGTLLYIDMRALCEFTGTDNNKDGC